MSSNKESLNFMLHKNQWIVSFIDNAGLNASMTDIGAKLKHNVIADQRKSYWFVPVTAFEKIRPILLSLGYSEFTAHKSAENSNASHNTAKPASADFQINSVPQTMGEKQLNPKHNPFLYPEINVQNPQAADEFTQNHTYSVSELNKNLNSGIKKFFPSIWLTGEVSGLDDKQSINPHAHQYLKLVEKLSETSLNTKEQTYTIDAKIWSYNTAKIYEKLDTAGLKMFKNGDKIRVYGKLNYYDVGGKLSFIIQDIDTFYAEGEFFKQKLKIENELQRLGLHETNKQLPFPKLPLRLAVFSAKGAAGMGDFERVLSNAGYPFKITLFTIALQGKNVEHDFLHNYQLLEQIGCEKFDLALVLRGGGDIVDLSAFNNFNIAKTIALSPLKFFIGIGHDRDRCVLDEIADRALTPTDAAKVLVDICSSLVRNLHDLNESLQNIARHHIESQTNNLAIVTERFTSAVKSTCQKAESNLKTQNSDLVRIAEKSILNASHHLACLGQNLQNSAMQFTHNAALELNSLKIQIKNQSDTRIHASRDNLKLLTTRVHDISTQNLLKYRREAENLKNLIHAYNPEKWFEKGFVLLSDKSGNPISSIQSIAPKDTVHIRMKDGKASASIKSVAPNSIIHHT